MANGEMLDELRALAEAEKIPTTTALRLLMAATAEMYEGMKTVINGQKDTHDLSEKIEAIDDKLEGLKKTLEETKRNPMVRLGQFMKDHPKWAWTAASILFLIFNLWFIPGFRRAILILLHVPPEIIQMLTS